MSARNYTSTAIAKTVGGTGILAGVNELPVSPNIDTLPTVYPYTLVIDPDTAKEEIVTVRSLNTGSVLNITRGQDGTSDVDHDGGAVIKHMITPRDLQEPQNHIEAASAYTIKNNGNDIGVTGPTITRSLHGLAVGEGAVVGENKSQTLTNKTVNLTNNTLTGTKAQFNTAMSDADFATIAGTETLTSKTLTSPVITGGTLNGGAALTVDSTELNHVDGVTSSIQTQLNGKLATTGGTLSGNLTVNGDIYTPTTINFGSGSGDSIVFQETGNTFTFNADGSRAILNVAAINASSSLNAPEGFFAYLTISSSIQSYGNIDAPSANFVRGGSVSITPVANVATSGNISWGMTMPSTPYVTVSANSNASTTKNVQFSSNSTTGCTVWLVRENTTTTVCHAIAVST
jgi:hypothetical protein